MLYRDLLQNIREMIGNRRHQALVQAAFQKLIGVFEGLVRDAVEFILAVGPKLPLVIFVRWSRQGFGIDFQVLDFKAYLLKESLDQLWEYRYARAKFKYLVSGSSN
jgi:hypothetical protein